MDHGRLPEEIKGNWIWEKSLINTPNSTLLVRKELILNCSHSVADFWISANCSYQLFVNERLVGFGPRANHSACLTYVDEYDLSYYLQQGANVIAVIVANTLPEKARRHSKVPGLWCQLNLDHKPLLVTDKSWDVFDAGRYLRPSAMMNDKRGITEAINFTEYPADWMKSPAVLYDNWHKPDYIIGIDEIKDNLEPCPLTPNLIDEIYFFENLSKGRYNPACALTHVNFNDIFSDPGVYAGIAFLFMDIGKTIDVEISGDSVFKFFCNKDLVKVKHRQHRKLFKSESRNITIELKAGWNRLLVLQHLETPGPGISLAFPGLPLDGLRIFQDTLEDAGNCWNIAGPLRMPLSEATASIAFERLNSQAYIPAFECTFDPASYLRNCDYKLTHAESSVSAVQGEYLLYKLEELKYGFLSLDIIASQGDIVDISLGQYLDGGDFPRNSDDVKNTHTMFCREGENKFIKFKPDEICYVMVSVRKALGKIEISNLMLSEFKRSHTNLTTFKCSDPELNDIWRIGRNATRRAASFICQNEPSILNACCLGDFYFQSCNLLSVYGDYHQVEVWLRSFAEAQFENGNIPAISFGEKIYSQLSHLFLFPTWLLFHYQNTADDAFLKRMAPHLDLIFELFKSLIDEETGLFKDVNKYFKSNCRLNVFTDTESGISTGINSLYCRFLLSSGELYRILGRSKDLFKCFKQAAVINACINKLNWNAEKHLYAVNELDKDNCNDLFTNFITLYSGVASNTEFENIFTNFFNLEEPFSRVPEQSDLPYFNFLFTETMFALGQTQWTLEYFKNYWKRRIDKETSAWRLRPDSKAIATTDFFRGNTICPNIFLIREVAGVRIAEPGFTTVYFNPAIDFVSRAELLLPTTYGSLRFEWEVLEDGSLDVIIDAKFPVKVLPELSSEMLKRTSFTLGKSVTLLDAAPEEVPVSQDEAVMLDEAEAEAQSEIGIAAPAKTDAGN
ncbi:MAG: hypothetical protein PHV59_09900 [Victivallales bacterium]|nr:hypothetical protein [Victivallales bacterium]